MIDKSVCPKCGRAKKPWFVLCFDCAEDEKRTPRCEVCNVEVQEGHILCKTHWVERNEAQKKLKSIDYIKEKKESEFREKYEGKFYFDSYKVKSKSELLICYFLAANGIRFQYEAMLTLNGKEIRPDFVIDDHKGNMIILEHFGLENDEYTRKRFEKEQEYKKLCEKNSEFHFIWTDEKDMYNLKEHLGKKLNATPLKKPLWK